MQINIKNIHIGIFLILFGFILIIWIIPSQVIITVGQQFHGSLGQDAPTARFIPYICAWLILLFGFLLSFSSYFVRNKTIKGIDNTFSISIQKFKSILSLSIICIFYWFTWPRMGYLESSVLAMAVICLIFGENRWLYIVILSILLPIALWYLAEIMHIPLSKGFLNL